MRFIKSFFTCIQGLENHSKRILLIGLLIFDLMYIIGFVLLLFPLKLFSDYTTALYWYTEFSLAGNRCLIACAAPVFIYEIIGICAGIRAKMK